MIPFNWSTAASTLSRFGGEPITLHVPKTGMPFFDTLQLYGAIDLYIGLREDVHIHDVGAEWRVEGRSRIERLKGRDLKTYKQVREKIKPKPKLSPEKYCAGLKAFITSSPRSLMLNDSMHEANGPLADLDSTLQSGLRGLAASSYNTLQSGQSSAKECIAHIPLAQGLLAFAGKKRTETVGDVLFLPVFKGSIDLSKVVSPLHAWTSIPNVLCAQALMILALKTSLFAEGYQDRLTSIVYNKRVKRGDFAYSGLISIDSTAIGRIRSSKFVAHLYKVFRALVSKAWIRGQTTERTQEALAMTYWLMQPVEKHLSAMITSQERIYRNGFAHMFVNAEWVREVFEMSHGNWEGDYETVRKFARAVASGIYYARMNKEKSWEDRQKVWYDEVTMLRSAPSAKTFKEKAMILVEQGHRENSYVGTAHWDQAFDPKALDTAIGNSPNSFEKFRELFRMYLIQESKPRAKEAAPAGDIAEDFQPEPEKENEE